MKLNKTIYNKLFAQAEEAKHQGLVKLAEGILEAIGPYPTDDSQTYTYGQLQDDIHKDMWKMASRLMVFYDVNSCDAEKIDKVLSICASNAISEMENVLGVEDIVAGPLEPKVFGEE